MHVIKNTPLLDKGLGMTSASLASNLPHSPLCMVLFEMHSLATPFVRCWSACEPSHAAVLQYALLQHTDQLCSLTE